MDVINLKISKVGGLTKARLMRDLCVAAGIPMTIEDTWGGDIVTAAIAHLARSTPEEFCFSATDFNSYGTITIADGAPRRVESLGLWSQPGLFAWDRLDPGSGLLLDPAPDFSGRGADLGCGMGVLSRAVLASPNVTELTLIDLDRRAVDAARRNIADPRARFLQFDLRAAVPDVKDLDFVIMNPPFHEGGGEDRYLGQAFIATAAAMLKRGGVCRLVANIALPYEAILQQHFATVTPLARAKGYKVFEARK